MPAARVEAETAPNRPAVARPSTFETPCQRAKVRLPINTMAIPTKAAPTAGTIRDSKSASRIEMPAPIPTFKSSKITMNL